MFKRSILSSYYKLIAGASLAFLALTLAGCNDKVAEKVVPARPVLVATEVTWRSPGSERSMASSGMLS